MPTYYELLKLGYKATSAEIELALESQYNQWRRLVTHHDPIIANQATQALQSLEQIRSTLTDSEKRKAYDAGLGLGGIVHGLADPEAILRSLPPVSESGRPDHSHAISASHEKVVDAWICPKCSIYNPVKTNFCKKCGDRLAQICPTCQELIEITAKFCQICGADILEAQQKIERQQIEKQEYDAVIAPYVHRIKRVTNLSSYGWWLLIIPYPLLLLIIPFNIYAYITSTRMLSELSGLISSDDVGGIIKELIAARTKAKVNITILGLIFVGLIIFLIIFYYNEYIRISYFQPRKDEFVNSLLLEFFIDLWHGWL